MTQILIRDAAPDDETAWRRLWAGFLDYYEVSLAPEVITFTWTRLMDETCPLKARLACQGDVALGFAIHQHHPSTWVAGDDCYLEDLFVTPDARGKGIARTLIEDLIVLSRARGWRRLYWNTDAGNRRARALYDSFVETDGHGRYRLTL